MLTSSGMLDNRNGSSTSLTKTSIYYFHQVKKKKHTDIHFQKLVRDFLRHLAFKFSLCPIKLREVSQVMPCHVNA